MQRVVPIGSTSYNVTVALRSSTTGQLVTGKVYGGVTYSYWRDGASSGATGTCITASKGTWASAGFVETDYAGLYQFGVLDACLLTGATGCKIKLVVADCIDTIIDVQLVSATRGLSGTALPDAAAGGNGGLGTTNGTKLNQTVDLTAGQSIACSALPGTIASDYARRTGDYSTLTQTQVSGGAYDLTNATYIAALKSGLGTIPASGNWATVGAAMTLANGSIVTATFGTCVLPAGSIVTATFGTCVTPETTKTALLPAVAAGAKSGLPILDASTGLILTGYGGGAVTTSPTAASIVTGSFGTCVLPETSKTNSLPASWPAAWPANWSWSTLTQTQVTGGAYDVTNASCVIHASGNWNTTTPPSASTIAGAVLDEAKGVHAGLLAGVALDSTVAKTTDITTAIPHAIPMKQINGTGTYYVQAVGENDLGGEPYSQAGLRTHGDSTWATATSTEANNLPSDYQQRGVAVTLPTAPEGYGGTGMNAADTRAALGLDTGNLDEQLGSIASAISASAGSGAYTIHLTVTDGTIPLEGAKVRMTKGAESYCVPTDALGRVNGAPGVGRDAGTWAVVITCPLYTFTPTTLVISDDASHTYEMTAVSIPPSDPDTVTGYLYCLDEDGEVEKDVSITLSLLSGPTAGYAYDTKVRTGTSDVNGLVSFTNMFPDGKYRIKRTGGTDKVFTVPATATTPYALPRIMGQE